MKYRAEIDGLRAVAVVSVILYHAQFIIFGKDWFEGGFIGVDIFFVISGYLITRIILTELFETGSFSFLQFYERRARRILPMLFAVILLSFAVAWDALLPADFIEYSKSILSSVFFFSNFFFYQVTTAYGADSALLKPLLHTWSLAIEEQFYIIFPILLLIFHKFFKQHMLALLFIMLLFSLQIADLMDGRNAALNFFFSLSRFWELLVGAILAYFELKYGRIKNETLSHILPALGLYLIAYSILFFDDKTPHPSFATLLPIIGVALLIAFASGQDLMGKILGSKPLVAVGLISYSAYLWHFPIFAFRRIASNNPPSNYDKFEWIVLTLILSVISYFLIEKPFRNKKRIPTKAMWAILGAIAMMIVGVAGYAVAKDGFEDRFYQGLVIENQQLAIRKICKGDRGKANHFCYVKNENSSMEIIMLGDSHAMVLSPDLFYRIRDDFSFSVSAIGGCPFSLLAVHPKDCPVEFQKKRMAYVQDRPESIVILSAISGMSNKSIEDGTAKGIVEAIYQVLNSGHHIIYVYPLPWFPFNPLKRIHNELSQNFEKNVKLSAVRAHLNKNPVTVDYAGYLRHTKNIFPLLDSIEHPNFHRVVPHKLFCDNQIKDKCVTHDGEKIFFFDQGHVSATGAGMVNDLVIEKIELIKEKLEK